MVITQYMLAIYVKINMCFLEKNPILLSSRYHFFLLFLYLLKFPIQVHLFTQEHTDLSETNAYRLPFQACSDKTKAQRPFTCAFFVACSWFPCQAVLQADALKSQSRGSAFSDPLMCDSSVYSPDCIILFYDF